MLTSIVCLLELKVVVFDCCAPGLLLGYVFQQIPERNLSNSLLYFVIVTQQKIAVDRCFVI